MDNITHSLIGLGVGELVHRSLAAEPSAPRQRTRHRLILVACTLASNAPDLDLLLTSLLPAPLGYLLNHRGHTHTLLYALPLLLLLGVAIWLAWPAARRLLRQSVPARVGFGAALLLGLALHLVMDYMNSYGLHPFAPFDARWWYGDMVFIVEPVFWIGFGVTMAMTVRRLLPKLLFLLALAGALLFFALQGYLAWHAFAGLLAMGLLLAALQQRAGTRGRSALWTALLLGVAFLGVQGYSSALGRQRVAATLQAIDPSARLLDVAMTAFPADPWCWNFVSVESNEAAGSYRLRRGLVNLAAGADSADSADSAGRVAGRVAGQCPAAFVSQPLAPVDAGGVSLFDQQSASLASLRALNRDSCYVAAWLRFARAPALQDGSLSDYRFGTGMGGDFTALKPAQIAERVCPQGVPRWGVPRADLLTPMPVAGH